MTYNTPFSVCDGIFYDRYFMPLEIHAEDIYFPVDNVDSARMVREGVNMVRLYLDDAKLADEDGNMTDNEFLKQFDSVIDQLYHAGFYVTLVPVTNGKAKGLDAALFTRQQRYFSSLFTRANVLSGKRLYEYENIAAMEILVDLELFEDQHFDLYCGRGMMEVFIEHYFNQRVRKVYSLDRGKPTDAQLEIMERHHIKLINTNVYKKRDNSKLKFEQNMPGIPESVIRGGIRQGGKSEKIGVGAEALDEERGDSPVLTPVFSLFPSPASTWAPIAISDAMSITEHAHANGGGEGWLTFASDGAVDLRLEFPVPVQTAVFRPSMKEQIETAIKGNTVELTLPTARYGALEVNYNIDDVPAYTVYILGDPVVDDPAEDADVSDIKFIEPGIHALKDLEYGDSKMLYFLPGLHEVEGDKIPMKSNCDIYIPRGTVVRAGVIAEEVENATFAGQGGLDGSTSPRDVGENKGERMGEKWMDDAGREGFVCFFKGQNITFDGPVIYNSNYWNIVISGTQNAVVRNHKAITWLQNTDGVQPRSCTNLLIERCFLKCADDCIAIKTRRTLAMESRDIICRDLVLWHDRVGNGLEIGHTSQADLLENVTFKNIYAIYGGGSGGCLSTHIIDHSTVRNVLFEDIYVEGRSFGRDFNLFIQPSYYTTDDERGHLKGVTFRNFYSDNDVLPGMIKGYDLEHLVEDVTFENVHWNYRNSEKHWQASEISEFLKENEYTKNIMVK